ncbi:MAG: site-specific integrase [Betaproteobacteria bacterium]|nr:site-specific integrase [Betaproteobacteria bacterium]
MDRLGEYELVRTLRSLLPSQKQRISDKTKDDYRKKYAKLLRDDTTPEALAKTPGSFYAYRAALIFCTAEEARTALKLREKATVGSPEWEDAMLRINTCLNRLQRYPPDPERQHHSEGSSSFTWQDVKPDQLVRHSKKYLLSALHRHGAWQEKIFEAVPEQYKAALAVLLLTGCRPSELSRGIKVHLVDGRLAFVIAGSKVSECSGQESRLLMLEPDSIAAKYLLPHITDGDMNNISLRNQKTFAEIIAVAGKQAFPRLRGRVSPYVFRHAFSSDLKSSGCDQAEIARALGHRVTRTQERYGRSAHGRGATSLVATHATQAVRSTHHTPVAPAPVVRSSTPPALIF